MSVLDMFEIEPSAEEEFCSLSWKIIEWKVAYYRPNIVHSSRVLRYTVSDDEYDKSEIRYLELCRELGKPNTVVHKIYPGFEDISYEFAMFEVDESRPSVQMVIKKLSTRE